MDKSEVQEGIQKLKAQRLQITTIKKELNKLNKEKESWFAKRSDINKEISFLISGVKDSKGKRNEITEQVKEYKKERDNLNKEIAEKVAKLKEMKTTYVDAKSKLNIKDDPTTIKKQIEKLEYIMETEPMSFSHEQKLMKEQKTLKKQLVDLGAKLGEWETVSKLSKEINKLRKQSNKAHKEIQKHAADSQVKHEVVLEKSKEIDELKVKEKEAYDKFKEYKDIFTTKNNELKALLKEADKLKSILEDNDVAIEEDKQRVKAQEVKRKAKEVNEKIKTGKKLTTEDLLIFQKVNK